MLLGSDPLRVLLAILSGIFAFAFYLAILRDALRQESKPNPTSWFIWAFNDTLILVASIAAGARNTLVVPLVYATFGWGIVALSVRNDRRSLTALELTCLIGSILSWISYFLPVGPTVALLLGVAVNTIGAVPTVTRLWRTPRAERFQSWILIWISGLFSVASLERYSLDLVLFPIDSFLISSLIVILTLRGGAATSRV